MFEERNYIDDWLKFEAEGDYSRGVGVLGAGKLESGAVLGRVLFGDVAVDKAAGFVGGGALTPDATTPLLAGAQLGVYRAVCIAEASNAGTFRVFDPNGVVLGDVDVGDTFANQIKFAIADSGEDFDVGDTFLFEVEAGSGEFVELDPAALDGSAKAAGILINRADATSSAADVAVLLRLAVVMPDKLAWPDGITDDQKAAALADLAALGILSDRVGA